jgi:hypothetical protein
MGGGVWTTLATKVLRSRWFVVVAGIWIQSTYGTAYCFGVYSQSLKLAMDYNQETLNTLAVFKTLGGAVGIVSGLLYDLFPWPWMVLAIGAVQNVFGYLMMWLAITARIARPPLWQMCVFLYVGTNSSTFAATAVVVTCLKIFPSNRGIVIGFLKVNLRLSFFLFLCLLFFFACRMHRCYCLWPKSDGMITRPLEDDYIFAYCTKEEIVK